jgi:hypothetical protein
VASRDGLESLARGGVTTDLYRDPGRPPMPVHGGLDGCAVRGRTARRWNGYRPGADYGRWTIPYCGLTEASRNNKKTYIKTAITPAWYRPHLIQKKVRPHFWRQLEIARIASQ